MADLGRASSRQRSEEVLVYDAHEPCPYLPGQVARMPLRLQLTHSPDRFDAQLADGDRRIGHMLYKPTCPNCNACIGLRIPVDEFHASRSQRRAWNRNQDVRVVMGRPLVTPERVELFNRHKMERSLGTGLLDAQSYAGWLVRSCAETREFAFYLSDRLAGVSIVDVGQASSSAVYFYFDPEFAQRSLGVFSVLYSIDWARRHGLRYHYLGLYVANNAHLRYKALFLPHEQLLGGQWIRVEGGDDG